MLGIGDAGLEARARRAAARAGLKARKSRRQRSVDNRGGFQLIDPARNFIVSGQRFDLSPSDVIEYCSELPPTNAGPVGVEAGAKRGSVASHDMAGAEPPAQTREVTASFGVGMENVSSEATDANVPDEGTRRPAPAGAATAGSSAPIVPPSDREAGRAAPFGDTSALAGAGAFSAGDTVVRPEPDAGRPIGRGSLSRIETDYANLLAFAISLQKLARDEIGRLSGERPNDPHTIENNKKQCDLLSIFADGFARLAAALIEYSERPQPLLAGKAKKIADDLCLQFEVWWQKNKGEAIDWAVRIPTLTASIAALGWTGANMTYATAAVSALIGGSKVVAAIKATTKRRKRP